MSDIDRLMRAVLHHDGDPRAIALSLKASGHGGYCYHEGECDFANGACRICGQTASFLDVIDKVKAEMKAQGHSFEITVCDACGNPICRCEEP